MRLDWLSASAAALIIGSFALVLGFLLNPLSQETAVSESMGTAEIAGQWLGSAVALFMASVGMTLGVPALLALVTPRSRRLGVLAAVVFAVGTIGMAGYGFMMLLLRALVLDDVLLVERVGDITADLGMQIFLGVWAGCFLLGICLLAVAMLRVRTVPRWVPALMLLFAAAQLVPDVGGDLVTVAQFLVLAVALTGASMAAHTVAVRRNIAGRL